MPRLLLLLFAGLLAAPAAAQPLADTSFTWQSYGNEARCHVHVYPSPEDEKRPFTIVVTELAENRGPSAVDDVSYLVEEIGRTYDMDPVGVTWIFHWGAFSYEGAGRDDRELFLRATFNRTSTQRLSSPNWRVVSLEDVEDYTDRRFTPSR